MGTRYGLQEAVKYQVSSGQASRHADTNECLSGCAGMDMHACVCVCISSCAWVRVRAFVYVGLCVGVRDTAIRDHYAAGRPAWPVSATRTWHDLFCAAVADWLHGRGHRLQRERAHQDAAREVPAAVDVDVEAVARFEQLVAHCSA